MDILIVDDLSMDNTKNIVKSLNDSNIKFIQRPRKLGLGTAHKLSLLYSIKFNYDFLITMDADFSHDPKHLPTLIKFSDYDNFVIGSRFCKNGKCNYTGVRKLISEYGNRFARKLLKLNIKEITTYYRVYSTKLLKEIPYDKINAQGYSLGVRLVWLMKKLKANLIEVPINFEDRTKGKSKIPKFQILISFFDLLILKIADILNSRIIIRKNSTYNFNDLCEKCEVKINCKYKKKYMCLACGELIDAKH